MSRLSGIAATATAAAIACLSCVPASEAAPPAGALGYVTEPSAASQGMPFVTTDGWTVRFERFALQVDVSASPMDTTSSRNRHFYGETEAYRFDAGKSIELFSRGLPVGPAAASVSLNGNYIGTFERSGRDYQEERTSTVGLSTEESARFRTTADVSQNSSASAGYASGPSILLVVRAERDARAVVIDVTIDASGNPLGQRIQEVKADALATLPLQIRAEALFAPQPSGGVLEFNDFGDADADHDGRVSAAELKQATTANGCGVATDVACTGNLADLLRGRAAGIFLLR